jgi:hypothetical protein
MVERRKRSEDKDKLIMARAHGWINHVTRRQIKFGEPGGRFHTLRSRLGLRILRGKNVRIGEQPGNLIC